ncbi:MAG: AAA family ATPase [Candidatus Gastranaerophilales bacterium]|nr:AAA family ATPase [Candidatus Gastranaerophilales bacterium]
MYIKKIIIHNFKSIENNEIIPFYKGLTIITGANGSGKTNIIDAVRFVLNNNGFKRLTSKQKEGLLFSGKNECSVAISCDYDGKNVSLMRRMTKNKSGLFSFRYYLNGINVNVEGYKNIINELKLNEIVENKQINTKQFVHNLKTSQIYIADNINSSLSENENVLVANFLNKKAKNKQIILVSMNKEIVSKANSVIEMPIKHKEDKLKSMAFSINGNAITLENWSLA